MKSIAVAVLLLGVICAYATTEVVSDEDHAVTDFEENFELPEVGKTDLVQEMKDSAVVRAAKDKAAYWKARYSKAKKTGALFKSEMYHKNYKSSMRTVRTESAAHTAH